MDGDAAAVLEGYPAMVNPSAAELSAELVLAESEANDVALADRDYDEAQAAAAADGVTADGFVDDVRAEVAHNTRHMDAPSQRRILRTYGLKFSFLEGEPQDGFFEETVGTGDGVSNSFIGTLANLPIDPTSITATDGSEVFVDTDNADGTGTLAGDMGGTGSIDYNTGAFSLMFMSPPATGAEVVISYLQEAV